jgi:hypothetical protein
LIEGQLKQFIENFDFYKQKHPSIIDDYMAMLLHVVINVLADKGFNEKAEEVNELSLHYFSGDAQVSPGNTL